MKYSIVTLFSDFFTSPLQNSLLAKAIEKGLISFSFHDPRDFSKDFHKSVDDTPYGGGAGMLMALPQLVDCIESIEKIKNNKEIEQIENFADNEKIAKNDKIEPSNNVNDAIYSENKLNKNIRYIALSPDGIPFTQAKAKELAENSEQIILLCGRYEGFDARIFDLYPIEKISLGDFVINGGESAALCLIEATARLLPNFMSKQASFEHESFNNDGLLEHNHYTKPPLYQNLEVPQVLLSGNHAHIEEFRHHNSLEKTFYTRPDIIENSPLTPKDRKFLKSLAQEEIGRNLNLALLHHPVIIKKQSAEKENSKDKRVFHEIGTSSVTNLDIHDIARSARTYNVNSLHIVTPLEDQAKLVQSLVNYWTIGRGSRSNIDRQDALSQVHHSYSWQEAIDKIEQSTGQKPLLIGTSAQIPKDKKGNAVVKQIMWQEVKKILKSQQILLLFGTSHGIDEDLLRQCDAILPPLRGLAKYNHLSVRAAAALCLDRIIGELG